MNGTAKSSTIGADWAAHIEAAEKFSGSISAYCKQHGLSPSRFYQKRKELRQAPVKPKAFASIKVKSPETEVSSKGPHLDPVWLARFLKEYLS